jgi:hypothetical protein
MIVMPFEVTAGFACSAGLAAGNLRAARADSVSIAHLALEQSDRMRTWLARVTPGSSSMTIFAITNL